MHKALNPGEQHTIHLPSFYELHSPYNSTRHLLFYPESSYRQDRNSQYPQNRTRFYCFAYKNHESDRSEYSGFLPRLFRPGVRSCI